MHIDRETFVRRRQTFLRTICVRQTSLRHCSDLAD